MSPDAPSADNRLEMPLIIMGHVVDLWNLPASRGRSPATPWQGPEDVKRVVREKRRMGFNAEHWLSADFKAGPCDGKFLFSTTVGTLRDDLAGYLPLAHAAGLRVFIYFNAHWYSDAMPDEMFIKSASGERAVAYGHGSLICPSGEFLAFSEQVARDLGQYDVDGVFIDGPSMPPCWCPACRKAFESRYGVRMPDDFSKAPVDVQLMGREFVHVRRRDYVSAVRRAVRWRKPGIAVYFNGDTLGRSIRFQRLGAEEMDLVGMEGGFIGYEPLRGQFRYKTGATAKTLEAIDPAKPRVVFIDHAFKKFDYYPLSAAEVRLMYAGTIANGAWPWFLVYWFNRNTPAGRAGAEMNRFIARNAAHLAGSRSLAEVALVQSDDTLELLKVAVSTAEDDVHLSGKKSDAPKPEPTGDPHTEMLGFYEALTRSQIPFDLLDDGKLAEGIDPRYKVVILPNCVAMSDDAVEAVKRFVEAGGSVIASFDTATRTVMGSRRERSALADLFGVASAGAVYGPSSLDYVKMEPKKPLARGIEVEAVPCPALSRFVTPAEGAAVLARYYGRMPGRYVQLPDVLPDAFAVMNETGKGKAIYFAGNIGEHYRAFAFDEHRRMIANAVRACLASSGLPGRSPASRGRSLVTVEGGGEFLEVSWRRAENGDYVLHLLNHAAVERPYVKVLPLPGLEFSARVAGKVKSVRAAASGKRIPFKQRAGAVTFAFNMTGEYEMIVISPG